MIDAYLSRIGYEGPRDPTPETLRALHERHMLSVPFENLDIHWQRPIVVDAARCIEKIVREQRGGFCYELNGAFAALLRTLGFDVTLLSARVPCADGTLGPPFDHMALLVRFGDQRMLADAGFGDSFVRPLDLDERGEQHDPAGVFRIAEGRMMRRHGDEWRTEYVFTLEPHDFEDFAPMCAWQQSSPDSAFTKKWVCSLATPGGRITLTRDRLIVTRDGIREERAVSADEWNGVLRDTFGIAWPGGSSGSRTASSRSTPRA
ncbi:MAG TPA: arylamine N-acetyltransferase [Thermoanaerobaculia bacterium]|nr:arylamine N-acetyltransferase [Thermoanaerobaculia bacterium]